jgi:lipoprotein LprG
MRLRLAALAVAAAVLAGCGGARHGGSAPSARDLAQETAAKTAAVKSFHFHFDEAHAPGGRPGLTITFADGDLVVPGAVRASIAGTLSGIPLRTDLIVAGGHQYLKEPFTGRWRLFDTKTNPVAFFDPQRGVLPVIAHASDLRNDGTDRVGGVDTYRISGSTRARSVSFFFNNPPSDRRVTLEVWIGKDDRVLRRLELRGPLADYEGKDIVRSLELSRLGEHLVIAAPAGAK